MSTYEAHPFFRAIGIALVVAVMAVVVWTGGDALRNYFAANEPVHSRGVLSRFDDGGHGHAVTKEHRPVLATPMVMTGVADAQPRSLKTYYERRAYQGAPPVVPHEISDERLLGQNCNTCHEKGGFVPEWQAYTPVTPHPEYANCLQCHAPGAIEPAEGFGEANQWVTTPAPGLHRPALPGAPPPVPHTMHLRDNCLACHAGPAAPIEIRTSHPERVNCVQCHAVPGGFELFDRTSLLLSSSDAWSK